MNSERAVLRLLTEGIIRALRQRQDLTYQSLLILKGGGDCVTRNVNSLRERQDKSLPGSKETGISEEANSANNLYELECNNSPQLRDQTASL